MTRRVNGLTRRVESVRKFDFDQDFDFGKSGLSWLLEFCLDLSDMYIDIGSSESWRSSGSGDCRLAARGLSAELNSSGEFPSSRNGSKATMPARLASSSFGC